jgi:hypothetical protein
MTILLGASQKLYLHVLLKSLVLLLFLWSEIFH